MDVKRNYFESDLGEGKAKYWTLNIEEAHRFNSIDEATEQLCKLSRPHLIKIRKVEGYLNDQRDVLRILNEAQARVDNDSLPA